MNYTIVSQTELSSVM